MKITDDWSYIGEASRELIQKGYACEDLHSIRFQFTYTNEEKAENIRFSIAHSEEEQKIHRIHAVLACSEVMSNIMGAIAQQFCCYQYQCDERIHYGSKDWDLFFWCNSFYWTLPGVEMPDRDYSYFTLTFNQRHTVDERAEICRRLLDFFQTHFADNPNLNVAVQHSVLPDEVKIQNDAEVLQYSLENKRIRYCGRNGKILVIGGQPFFKASHARKTIFRLSPNDVLQISFLQDKSKVDSSMQTSANLKMEEPAQC